ncbi:hypothetical protein AWB94_00345 [Mycolicibacterium canariasense]|nr:hypothetical protein AWB94_00345 [Mycolicibacterium canariasense]
MLIGAVIVATAAPSDLASGPSGGVATTTSLDPTVEATTMAVPAIRGKVPLYPGQAPNADPQG